MPRRASPHHARHNGFVQNYILDARALIEHDELQRSVLRPIYVCTDEVLLMCVYNDDDVTLCPLSNFDVVA